MNTDTAQKAPPPGSMLPAVQRLNHAVAWLEHHDIRVVSIAALSDMHTPAVLVAREDWRRLVEVHTGASTSCTLAQCHHLGCNIQPAGGVR